MTPSEIQRAEMDREAAQAMGWEEVEKLYFRKKDDPEFIVQSSRIFVHHPGDTISLPWSPTTDANDANRLLTHVCAEATKRIGMFIGYTVDRTETQFEVLICSRESYMEPSHAVYGDGETEPLAKTKAALLAVAGRES